jgi:hypothetical protein
LAYSAIGGLPLRPYRITKRLLRSDEKGFGGPLGAGSLIEFERAAKGKDTMDVSKFMGSAFLRLEEFEGRRQDKIASVRVGDYDKLVLHLESGDRLSLNASNTKTLARAYGRDGRDWHGREIELFVGQVKFKGQMQDSILVRPISPPLPLEQRRVPEPEPVDPITVAADLNDEIPF